MTHYQYLQKLAYRGLQERNLYEEKEYLNRLQYELGVIEKLGFSSYFLVMWDIACFCRETGIIYGAGRGSAAGSLVLYSLKVTKIDPIRYKLYFERFLTPDRINPPDVDFDSANRDKIIHYLQEKYGKDRVCVVGSQNFMRTKSAIWDVSRKLEKGFTFSEELSALVPPPKAGLWESFEKECEIEPRLLSEKYKEVIDPIKKLWGTVRSYGTHAGGITIAPGPINRYVPLYKGKDDNPTSQFDWRDLEAAGLLKFDLLGLSTLEVVEKALKLIEARHGIQLDLDSIPDGDEKTYQLIRSGELEGIFQLGGSDSIVQLTVNMQPESIEDLTTITSLFRPGPLRAGMTNKAVAIKQGKEKIKYLHPTLEPILKDTSGLMIYQEQIMRICSDICGYSGSEADTIRKYLGKKLKDKLQEERQHFIKGAVEKSQWPHELASALFDDIQVYAEYLFVKSHGVSYSRITYETAYLKTHYPTEFFSALLTLEKKPGRMLRYASATRKVGITFLPPHINLSQKDYYPEGEKSIRIGLNNIKGMPIGGVDEILENRPITSLEQLSKLSKINAKALDCLGLSGALESLTEAQETDSASYAREILEWTRKVESWKGKIERWKASTQKKKETYQTKMDVWNKKNKTKLSSYQEKYSQWEIKYRKVQEKNLLRVQEGKQLLLFPKEPSFPSLLKEPEKPEIGERLLEPLKPILQRTRLDPEARTTLQRELLKFYLDTHPVDFIQEQKGITKIGELEPAEDQEEEFSELFKDGDKITLIAVVTDIKKTQTKSGGIMARLQVEDKTGLIEVVLFPGTWSKYDQMVEKYKVYRISGRLKLISTDKTTRVQLNGFQIVQPERLKKEEWTLNYPLFKGFLQITPDSFLGDRQEAINVLGSISSMKG